MVILVDGDHDDDYHDEYDGNDDHDKKNDDHDDDVDDHDDDDYDHLLGHPRCKVVSVLCSLTRRFISHSSCVAFAFVFVFVFVFRVEKCHILYTEQIFQTKFYPIKSA